MSGLVQCRCGSNGNSVCVHCGHDVDCHLAEDGAQCPHPVSHIDRRRSHIMWDGALQVVLRGVESCSGCFEGGDYMGQAHLYPFDKKAGCYIGAGCDECGYTGKRRREHPVPARLFYGAPTPTTEGS